MIVFVLCNKTEAHLPTSIMLAHIFVTIVGIIACSFVVDCVFKLVFGTALRKLKGLWKYSFFEQADCSIADS